MSVGASVQSLKSPFNRSNACGKSRLFSANVDGRPSCAVEVRPKDPHAVQKAGVVCKNELGRLLGSARPYSGRKLCAGHFRDQHLVKSVLRAGGAVAGKRKQQNADVPNAHNVPQGSELVAVIEAEGVPAAVCPGEAARAVVLAPRASCPAVVAAQSGAVRGALGCVAVPGLRVVGSGCSPAWGRGLRDRVDMIVRPARERVSRTRIEAITVRGAARGKSPRLSGDWRRDQGGHQAKSNHNFLRKRGSSLLAIPYRVNRRAA